jgi:hypothetical protein
MYCLSYFFSISRQQGEDLDKDISDIIHLTVYAVASQARKSLWANFRRTHLDQNRIKICIFTVVEVIIQKNLSKLFTPEQDVRNVLNNVKNSSAKILFRQIKFLIQKTTFSLGNNLLK